MRLIVSVLGSAFLCAAAQPARAQSDDAPGAGSARVERSGEWFYVDGEPFLVKGVGYSPFRPGEVPWKHRVDLETMEADFRRIAEAGFNTLRTWSPLSPEALDLADRHGLMVLQGIWIHEAGDYASPEFLRAMSEVVRKEVDRANGHDNVLAFLIGNELQPEKVFATGIPQTEVLLERLTEVVKSRDPTRLVSYANWPVLTFLKPTSLDIVCFNLYPYDPPSIAHTFGFRSYIEHLKRTVAGGRPLVISEVGLSVSPESSGTPGYGGHSPARQRTELLGLWDAIFQAGAQGGVIFEWNDEWWKNGGRTADETTHDRDDPEEWFGLIEFTSAEDRAGRPRPSYEALKEYNQAVLLSPVTGTSYQGELPVAVYATGRVSAVRVQFGRQGWFPKWHDAAQISPHWWKARLPIGAKLKPGEHQIIVEANGADRRLLVRQRRLIRVGPAAPEARVSIDLAKSVFEIGPEVEPISFTIKATDALGRPLARRKVWYAVAEPEHEIELTQIAETDEQGMVRGSYLLGEAGLISLSAAVAHEPARPDLRAGDEVFLEVRRAAALAHRPSVWEAGLPSGVREALRHETAEFRLADPGNERLIDYERYGRFHGRGTAQYRYEVQDWKGLAAAAGEGVYPNEGGLLNDPAYQAAVASGALEGSQWDFTWHLNVQLGFFKWAGTDEELGVKQLFTALTLERAGLWDHAIKAYYAVLVHFPQSVGWTAFEPPTPYYVARVAQDKIIAILRLHPELGLRLDGSRVVVEGGYDNDVSNDSIVVDPGQLVEVAPEAVHPPTKNVAARPVTDERGGEAVRLVRHDNGHWRLLVGGEPWIVRGMTYKPSAVGESPDEASLKDWSQADRDGDGTLDVFQTFVDANGNDARDADEPVVGDFALLHEMGVNTLRLFHTDNDPKTLKPILRDLHERFGFMVMMGDFVGMYTVGSGAAWEEGTDYLDSQQRTRMFESVKRMVREYKDEPYLLVWALGNENNYGGVHGIVGGVGNAGQHPREYYGFLNELAAWIHNEDPAHPVGVGNGDLGFLDLIGEAAPELDYFGANVYRGWYGFGHSFFSDVRRELDKAVLIMEYGCPAYQQDVSLQQAEVDQALYHMGNWVDIADHVAGRGVGNAIGGIAFEWSDEWWKAGQPPRFSPLKQETVPNWAGPYPGGWNFEEWYGLVGQGGGGLSPFLRRLRVGYEMYRVLWRGSVIQRGDTDVRGGS